VSKGKVKKVIRYSEAFKRQVVKELEEGDLESISEAKEKYGIRGNDTISSWLRKYGKREVVKIVRTEKADERREIERLREENQRLKSALADVTVENLLNQRYFEAVCEQFGVEDIEGLKKTRKRVSKMRWR